MTQKSNKVQLVVDLRALRQQTGCSAHEASHIIGIGESTLTRTETGAIPDLAIALKIAASYKIPAEQIWGFVEEEEEEETEPSKKKGKR